MTANVIDFRTRAPRLSRRLFVTELAPGKWIVDLYDGERDAVAVLAGQLESFAEAKALAVAYGARHGIPVDDGGATEAAPAVPRGYSIYGDTGTDGTAIWRVVLADAEGIVHESWEFEDRAVAVSFLERKGGSLGKLPVHRS